MSAILFSEGIGPVPVEVILSEGHKSTLGITEIPIETGAKITDHAYVEPKKLTLDFADGNAAQTWNALVQFQESRVPFVIVSGLAVYKNMLIKELSANRDQQTCAILAGRCELQEVIIVSTAYTPSESGDGKKGSNGAKTPTKETAGDNTTKDRATGTNARGDQGSSKTTPPAENKSILRRAFG